MARKLIIDADPGIGDALAVVMAACHPEIDLLAVTAAAGSVSGEQATRNLLAVISLLDPPRWPRFGVSEGSRRGRRLTCLRLRYFMGRTDWAIFPCSMFSFIRSTTLPS